MKASEVMRILGISRSTLCQYVKQKKILYTVNKSNNRYSYIPSSVYKLATNDSNIQFI
jgi:predicted site-specific integrase-resolvase